MNRRHQFMRSPLTLAARMVACCAVALALAGCGAGQVTQTDAQVAAIDGASADLGNLALRDVLVPYPEEQHGVYPAGSDVPLQLTLVNQTNRADTLMSVSSPIARQVLVEGTTTIPAGFSVTTTRGIENGAIAAPTTEPTTPEPTTTLASPLDVGELRVVLLDIVRPLRPGQNIDVVFAFRNGGKLTMSVPMGPPIESERKPFESGGHG